MVIVMLTQETLKSILHYDPTTGYFTRLKNSGGYIKGTVAGGVNAGGYIDISVLGKRYRAHRLAFLYMIGSFPDTSEEVDHINRVRSDNRWCNLRSVTRTENNRNTSAKGYSYDKATGKYKAQIMVDSKNISLGRFNTIREAEAAYMKAKAKYH